MNHAKSAPRIAIIGVGPRGLGALEALAEKLPPDDAPLTINLFDPFPACGAGPNFDPQESPSCLLNIPIRDIAIRAPTFLRCGNFAEWLSETPDPDSFPTRADLGRYLEARLEDVLDHDSLHVSRSTKPVEAIDHTDDGWMLRVDGQQHGPYAEVLLTLGQPDVVPDDQWAEWQDHTQNAAGTLANAYPAWQLQDAAAGWSGQVVAIRGLALSAFDIIRVLTQAQGGVFADGGYQPSGREPASILPFSLDGKPPFPKPATEALDARFTPRPEETEAFSVAITEAANVTPDSVPYLINTALIPVVTRIQQECGAPTDPQDVADWLDTEWSAPGDQETGGAHAVLQQGIALAEGATPPTIGYTIGQIWRKWQDQLRVGYNPAETPPETAKVIVGFDEGMKRYSYGPPLSSALELAALNDAGIVDLDYTADPDIALVEAGWTLTCDGQVQTASVMIDAVMPAPDLEKITAPLVNALLKSGQLHPISEGFGANIAADGSLIAEDGNIAPGLCLLGRLALGSVIAVDSLHDCFGAASDRWAEGVVGRLGN
ncbi:FAD/NAD(P)-binding protein [Loktanella agnita]|uniref:FAD/NAD(P)-binding protein n=1 Tax=Loktanella agnita TaxID=287097 RepID=UPI003987DE0E